MQAGGILEVARTPLPWVGFPVGNALSSSWYVVEFQSKFMVLPQPKPGLRISIHTLTKRHSVYLSWPIAVQKDWGTGVGEAAKWEGEVWGRWATIRPPQAGANSRVPKRRLELLRGFSWPANQKYVQHVWAEISQVLRVMWPLRASIWILSPLLSDSGSQFLFP